MRTPRLDIKSVGFNAHIICNEDFACSEGLGTLVGAGFIEETEEAGSDEGTGWVAEGY